jgi:phage terminase large subunit-like protein
LWVERLCKLEHYPDQIEWEPFLKQLPGYDPYLECGDAVFDPERAAKSLLFIENHCRHVKGELAGQRIKLEVWQRAFIANLFGWVLPDGKRRFREAFLYIPRGNAKTTLAAAILLVVFYLDNEGGAEIYSAAADRAQARLCFEIVEGMIRQDKDLNSKANIFKYSIRVKDRKYEVLSSDAGTKHGLSPSLAIIDELHAHKSAELTETLMTGMLKRAQPLTVHMTTADFERESLCNSKYKYACSVRDSRTIDRAFLPAVFEASPKDDWRSPAVWAKANPNWDVMDHEYFARECERAKIDPSYENTFKRLHLNVKTQTDSIWIGKEIWERGNQAVPELDGRTCFAGVDLGFKDDLSAVSLVFPLDDGRYAVTSQSFACKDSKRDLNKEPFPQFIRNGTLTPNEGDTVNIHGIYQYFEMLMDKYKVASVAFDCNNAAEFGQNLQDKYGLNVFKFYQSKRNYNEPMRDFSRALKAGEVCHQNDPLLTWSAFNTVTEEDHMGNIMPSKRKSSEKIDPIVALLMAWHEAKFAEDNSSAYDNEGGGLILL